MDDTEIHCFSVTNQMQQETVVQLLESFDEVTGPFVSESALTPEKKHVGLECRYDF